MSALLRASGGAPEPDAERVSALLDRLSSGEPAALAEAEIKSLTDTLDRVLAETRTGDLTEAEAQLTHARAALSGLDPAALEPRKGLAGLFDGRGKRLKAFRARFTSAAHTLGEAAGDIAERSGGVQRRDERLEGLWGDLRGAVVDLDVCRAAGAQRCPPVLVEEDGADEAIVALRGRLSMAETARTAALRALPCIRAAQNGNVQALALLNALPGQIEAWRADWTDALGLGGRKLKKVRPHRARLEESRSRLLDELASAERALSEAKVRRSDVETRLAALRRMI